MLTGPNLRQSIMAARERMAEGRQKLREQHDSGSPGIQVCARLTDLLDTVVLDVYEAALDELGEEDAAVLRRDTALVPNGGYGRRDVAPFSDVDLMLLHMPAAKHSVQRLARRLTMDLCDVGLTLGFNVRTPRQACQLAMGDATIFTSLAEARFLSGSVGLFSRFVRRLHRATRRRRRSLLATLEQARREERRQFGETVYLLEPNIKRSRGGLRDIQLLRWIGFARYGETEPASLGRAGVLSKRDERQLRRASEFLLRLRNELHFHAGKSFDLLDRGEQVRLAELYDYDGDEALLPVERFMQDYFRHTSEVRNMVANFAASARPRPVGTAVLGPLLSHQVEGDFRVGPIHIGATRRGTEKVRGDLAQVLRLMDLANLYTKRIDHSTWEAIRQTMIAEESVDFSDQTRSRFLSLLSQPGKLGDLLRGLHELHVLEKIVPAFAHARCLLQFNEYHKYTVDEHSIRAVQRATEFLGRDDTLGDVYRGINEKQTLHLALLIHDLGKGFTEDHSDVGRRIAVETAKRLKLPQRQARALELLVHKHLAMSHLAFRRDTSDESVVVRFAVDIGSPDLLKMLYVLTCADLAAVGPGVLNRWKLEVLTDLYLRSMNHLAGDTRPGDPEERLGQRRDDVRALVTDKEHAEWFARQIDALPRPYLLGTPPQRIVDDLGRLRQLEPDAAVAWGRYLEDRRAVEYTVGTNEQIVPGIFHRLTGALTSQGMQILSAEINTLADGLVLDCFYVHDDDYAGQPPTTRLEDVSAALVASLDKNADRPTFRRLWRGPADGGQATFTRLPTQVHTDNNTSATHTIVDIFTHDRRGLLYTITRTLFELGASVELAKIGTYLDQVVDVFYVTDEAGQKIKDEHRLAEIRRRLLEAVEQMEEE